MTIILDGTTGITTPAINSSGDLELPGGTANGVLYLNGSKVATSGSALVFDGTNLGVGVTPSAWFSNGKAMQLGTGAFVLGTTTATQVLLGANFYFDGTNSRYIGTGQASYYEQNAGTHVWYQTASGTADDPITFTQAMTLDASGNLGVGTTSPSGRLDIRASGAVQQYIISTSATSQENAIVSLANNGAVYSSMNFDSADYKFKTSGTESARITAAGQVLFGTTNDAPDAGSGFKFLKNFHAVNDDRTSILCASSTTAVPFTIYSTGAGAYRFFVEASGTVYATNTTISAISDQRHKENIRDLDVGLDAVLALKPRKFDWKEGKGKNIKDDRGFIAQEFEQVFPDLVDQWLDPAPEGEEPYKSVRQDLIPVLVKAIQEQQAMIEGLKAEIDQLKGT